MDNEGMALGYLPFDGEGVAFNGGGLFEEQEPMDTLRTTMFVSKLVNDPEIKAEINALIDELRPTAIEFVRAIKEFTPKFSAALNELLKEE